MPRFLERVITIRDKFKIRKDPPPNSQKQRNVFNGAKTRMDNVSNRIQKRTPQFLSQANEALGTWQPGNRITNIMPVEFGKQRNKRGSNDKKPEDLDFSMSVQST